MLSDNHISEVQHGKGKQQRVYCSYQHFAEGFKSLTSLFLVRNKMSDVSKDMVITVSLLVLQWSSVSSLDSLPLLKNVKISGNPVMRGKR